MTGLDAMTDGLEPVKTSDINQIIQQRLVSLIQDRKLVAGDKLPTEAALGKALGVSRGSLREAMRSLEATGLIEARAGSGWYVRDFSLDKMARPLSLTLTPDRQTMLELEEARWALEDAFLAQIVPCLKATDLDTLAEIVAEMDAIAHEAEPLEEATRAFNRKAREFHTLLMSKVANRFVREVNELFFILFARLARTRTREQLLNSARLQCLMVSAMRTKNLHLLHRMFQSHRDTSEEQLQEFERELLDPTQSRG